MAFDRPQPRSHRASHTNPRECAFFGLLTKRAVYVPTWRAIVMFALVVLAVVLFVMPHVASFLTPYQPLGREYLIVEGWIPPYAARRAAEIFEAGGYQKIITCGGPVVDDLAHLSGNSYAQVAASRLMKCGMSSNDIIVVPAGKTSRDRTYSASLGVRKWFEDNNVPVQNVDIVSCAAHGRRSRMLARRAFGPSVKVGILSIPDPDYDPAHWWRSSAGFRDVLGETIAYIYAIVSVEFLKPQPLE
jgi:hypothetical protein